MPNGEIKLEGDLLRVMEQLFGTFPPKFVIGPGHEYYTLAESAQKLLDSGASAEEVYSLIAERNPKTAAAAEERRRQEEQEALDSLTLPGEDPSSVDGGVLPGPYQTQDPTLPESEDNPRAGTGSDAAVPALIRAGYSEIAPGIYFLPGDPLTGTSDDFVDLRNELGISGGGGTSAPTPRYGFTTIGGQVYRTNDLTGAIEPTGISAPGFTNIDVDRQGNLVGIDQNGEFKVIQPGFGFAGIDPERTQAVDEAGVTGFFGGAPTLARDQLGESRRQADLSANVRGFESVNQLAPQLGKLALDNAGFTRDVLRTPADFLARAFFQRGQTSPLPQVSQADVINQLRGNIGQFNEVLAGFRPQTPEEAVGPSSGGSAAPVPTAAPEPIVPGSPEYQAAVAGVTGTKPWVSQNPYIPPQQAAAQVPPAQSLPQPSYPVASSPPPPALVVPGPQSAYPPPTPQGGFGPEAFGPNAIPPAPVAPNIYWPGFVPTPAPPPSAPIPASGGGVGLGLADPNSPYPRAREANKPQKDYAPDPFGGMGLIRLAGGGFAPHMAVVGEKGPELAVADPMGGFHVLNQEQLGFNPEKMPNVPKALNGGFFQAPQLPTPDLVNQADLQALEASVRPPAVNSVLTGSRPSPLRFGFSTPTPQLLGALTPDEYEALGTTLATQYNTSTSDLETDVRQRFGSPGVRGSAYQMAGFVR